MTYTFNPHIGDLEHGVKTFLKDYAAFIDTVRLSDEEPQHFIATISLSCYDHAIALPNTKEILSALGVITSQGPKYTLFIKMSDQDSRNGRITIASCFFNPEEKTVDVVFSHDEKRSYRETLLQIDIGEKFKAFLVSLCSLIYKKAVFERRAMKDWDEILKKQ